MRVSLFLGLLACASATSCPKDFASKGCKKNGADCDWIFVNTNGGICTKCDANAANPGEVLDKAFADAIGGEFCPEDQTANLDCPTPTTTNGCRKDGYDCDFVVESDGKGGQQCTKCNKEGEVLTAAMAGNLSPAGAWCPVAAGTVTEAPKNVGGAGAPVDKTTRPFECEDVKVTHDTLDHWLDGCLGLTLQPDYTTAAACEDACKKDMKCSVWQFSEGAEGASVVGPHCDYGTLTTNCRSRTGDKSFKSLGGQRIQHGSINVLSDNTGVKMAMGLYGFPMHKKTTGDEVAMSARCKDMCYSDVTCTAWQYGEDGCWIENLPGAPVVSWSTDNPWLKTMVGGETIEHTCPKPVVPEETNWPLIVGLVVAGLLALGAILYMVLKPKPKVKKTRAVKIQQEEAPLFIPQPTIMIPQAPVQVVQAPTYQLVQQPSVVYQGSQVLQQPMLNQGSSVIYR